MKKFAALLLAILMVFTACATAFAAGSKSPTVQDLYRWNPPYEWKFMDRQVTMEDIDFAKPMILQYMSEKYELWDALQLHVEYPYAIVRFEAPTVILDGDYMFILVNEENTYYITPIIVASNEYPENAVAVMDFTGIEPAWYDLYIVHDNV